MFEEIEINDFNMDVEVEKLCDIIGLSIEYVDEFITELPEGYVKQENEYVKSWIVFSHTAQSASENWSLAYKYRNGFMVFSQASRDSFIFEKEN